jgi:hypothetical protein
MLVDTAQRGSRFLCLIHSTQDSVEFGFHAAQRSLERANSARILDLQSHELRLHDSTPLS